MWIFGQSETGKMLLNDVVVVIAGNNDNFVEVAEEIIQILSKD
jgi:hypothetical protein